MYTIRITRRFHRLQPPDPSCYPGSLEMPQPSGVRTSTRFNARSTIQSVTIAACFALVFASSPSRAQSQSVKQETFDFPSGPPPSGLQAPLPKPSRGALAPGAPLRMSPTIEVVLGHPLSGPLQIQDVVAISLYANRSIALAQQNLMQAQGRTSEARAAFNPTLSSVLSETQLSQTTSANISGANVTLANATQAQVGVQATLPIDISGMLKAATDQAKFQEIVARLDVNRARNQIVLDVKTAFYDALRAQALLDVARENLRNSVARQSDAQKRLDAGVVAPYDLQRAATDVASSQLQVLSAKNQVTQSLYSLKNAMGVDLASPLTITDKGATETPPGVIEPENGPITPPRRPDEPIALEPAEPVRLPVIVTDPLPVLPDYQALLNDALSTRPEILEADASIAAARKSIALAMRGYTPSLGLVVGGIYTPNVAGFGAETTSASAILSLNLPLYDGGVARARKSEARAGVAEALTNRRQVVDSIEQEMQATYQTLRISRDSLAVANQSVALAREAFRLARVRYQAGVTSQAGLSPLLEVTDAQTALALAESNQVNALYDYNNARSRLDKAVGRYAFVFNSGKEPAYLGFPTPPSPKTLGKNGVGSK